MRKLIMFLCMGAFTAMSYGKAVDVNTAQTVAYNYYKSKANVQSPSDLSLAYTASSVLNGSTVNEFYIFNFVPGTGFVIISADDKAMPVLGYSTESSFTTTRMNSSFQYLLDNYKKQIAYAIQSNISAAPHISDNWDGLKNGTPRIHTAARTTSLDTQVNPMLKTIWDQANSYGTTLTYNADCPYDAIASPAAQTVTGCVATAMAQAMKYWNWPDTGVGSHSYIPYNPDGLPVQSANFATAYHFDSMPTPRIVSPNAYVAKLMYYAGVSVDMDYGTPDEGGSGAAVTIAYSYGSNCAEYALNTYFKYPKAKGIQRQFFDQADWIDTMMNEMSSGRPVIYAGDGNAGGHCWMMDGYNTDTMFHFNFGWSGNYDGFFSVNNIAPGIGDTFNNDQEAIIRIIPDTPVAKISKVQTAVNVITSAASSINIFPNPAANEINIAIEGTTANEIWITDIEGREMQQFIPANGSKMITLPVNELPDGVYLLKFDTDQGTITRKVLVSR